VEYLADDYELGVRISRAGYSVALGREVVETGVPEYSLRGFWEHQLRWMRTMKDSRAAGYFGMVVTYALAWALLNCIASGFALWSFSLLSLVLLVRMAVALTVGVGVLRDRQALRDCWLLPLRDCVGLLLWVWSYADNTVVWRGEKFLLSKGKLLQIK
jgi:ceramide glucosyltransferase